MSALVAALLAYSQSVAYFGNESFHLLASQLINAGKTPYQEFFYQHPPLFIYLNAGWMRIFGEDWRSAHILSALLSGGCIVVVASYLFNRLADAPWRLETSVMAAALLGLNFYVIAYGTVALPFGLCLLLTIVSFRLTVEAVRRSGVLLAFLAGLSAGGSAASSLLTAPLPVVLFVWLARYNDTGARLRKCLAFAGGMVVPFLPLLWISLLAPRQVFFDIVEYHLFHRIPSETNIIRWNLREILAWFGSVQTLVLLVLAAICLSVTINRRDLDRRRRSEFYLCAWLTVVLGAYIAAPRPTFAFYFVLVTPFLIILAASGFHAIGSLVWLSNAKAGPVAVLAGLLYLTGLGWQAYGMRREILGADHKAIEAVAREINRVTPPDGWVFAFEQVYFEARRLPPPGMENAFNPFSRRDEWLAANRFATVCVMADDPRIESLHLFDRYANNKTIRAPNFTIYVFWDLAGKSEPGTGFR